jgi:hypothetical protein
MFKKKPQEPQKPQEETPTENLNVGKEAKQDEVTLEELIASKPEAWYKEQVLLMLADIREVLEKIKEIGEK